MGKRNHKQTAWKKNREFGDRMGGRLRLKMEDNIFACEHSFTAPSEQASGRKRPFICMTILHETISFLLVWMI